MTSPKSMLEFRDMGLGRIDAVFEDKIVVGMIIEQHELSRVVWMFRLGDIRVPFRQAQSKERAEDEITHWLFMALGAPSNASAWSEASASKN